MLKRQRRRSDTHPSRTGADRVVVMDKGVILRVDGQQREPTHVSAQWALVLSFIISYTSCACQLYLLSSHGCVSPTWQGSTVEGPGMSTWHLTWFCSMWIIPLAYTFHIFLYHHRWYIDTCKILDFPVTGFMMTENMQLFCIVSRKVTYHISVPGPSFIKPCNFTCNYAVYWSQLTTNTGCQCSLWPASWDQF